ncbi:putative zinc-binding metallopeptidase [Lewinella sp. IMCC34183]|uniref:zinc-binding metallopeptidase family protein n=1 Tax=Lewinella sp. IMCC34183 TaxID=2248762 RepID=UPI000E2519B8|nr:putative zinc-binding peptidase [Lewinella sp. IMCC34183]
MKIYHCTHCNYPVYFENVVCGNCSSYLGYDAPTDRMVALAPGDGPWMCGPDNSVPYIYCDNHQHAACNWLIPQSDETGLCDACDLNRTVPDLSDPEKLEEWQQLELAKHRLVYALNRLGLPVQDKMSAPDRGLAFDFLADTQESGQVMTGHDEGLITLNVKEADPVKREATRIQLHEKYRTLIGHFRHEVGHYYWDVIVEPDANRLAEFRRIFGDDRADYGEALKKHYQNGPPADWQQHYISEYATMHPWEDWAETWAHYLHLMDMLETAHAFGMRVDPPTTPDLMMNVTADFDPYQEPDMERILKACVPLTFAINSLNRGMGRPDLYPFVINASVREKLRYVHEVVRNAPSSL